MWSVTNGWNAESVVERLTDLGVPKVTYGSNANGEWMKTFDQAGNVLSIVQQLYDASGAAGIRTKTLPVELPNDDFSVNGMTSGGAALTLNYSPFTWYPSNTTTTFDYAIRTAAGAFSTVGCKLTVIWLRA